MVRTSRISKLGASLFQDEQGTKIQITQSLAFVKMFFICRQADNDTMAYDVRAIYFRKALTLAKTILPWV